MMLNDGLYGWKRIFKTETVNEFTTKANVVDGSSRLLGWDSPGGYASGGIYLSDNSFGHTGFTGTSMWIDPDQGIIVILLTNAVHPNRKINPQNITIGDRGFTLQSMNPYLLLIKIQI